MITNNAINNGGSIMTVFDANGTWTKNSRTNYIEVYIWNGGQGGGSGRIGANNSASGGAGGAPGSTVAYSGSEALFGATESVVIGAGGTGGASITAGNDDTNGNDGVSGGSSSFGNIKVSAVTSVAPGGRTSQTYNLSYFTQGVVEGVSSYRTGLGPFSSGGVTFGNGSTGDGFSGLAAPDWLVANQSSISVICPAGGGGGGGYQTSSTPTTKGGNGGGIISLTTKNNVHFSPTVIHAGGAGGDVTSDEHGSDGADIDMAQAHGLICGGSGGGGGAGDGDGSGLVGNGGNGGIPGAGGGGGGAAGNGTGKNSGKGGNGGQGRVVVIEYF